MEGFSKTTFQGALSGVRILDLTRVLAGPFCGAILADLGAEVIKIESPWGDDSREFGPFWKGHSAYYRLFNRNKFGITLDLKEPKDKETFLGLVERADVVLENFRPGVMDKLGLGAATLMSVNPKLIVTSISGFGQHGSMNKAPAYDLVAQAMSGLMSITGHKVDQPTRVGVSLGDLVPGLYATIATLGALQERDSSGRGQHVDIAMFDSLVSILESVAMRELYEEGLPEPVGNDHAMTVPFSTYTVSDGEVVIACSNEALFARFVQAVSLEWMLEDERFALNASRVTNREIFRRIVEEHFENYTVSELVNILRTAGVPTSTVANVSEALHGELGTERKVLTEESDGFITLSSPIRIRGSRDKFQAAPDLGEHNELIGQWLGEEPR